MEINVTGQGLAVTASMKDFVLSKLAKLEDISKDNLSADVVLAVKNHHHEAHIEISIGGHKALFSSHSSFDMYESIQSAVNKVIRQLKDFKDIHNDHSALHKED